MIAIRQGRTKTLVESSRNSALCAVENYNKPNAKFRIENYIVLMIIAWTKLFHAYFQSTIGEGYFYKNKSGRYEKVDGEKKGWDLSECIKQYQKTKSNIIPISPSIKANIEFFISIRNKIEHRFWDSSELDMVLFGECQALLYNYENFLISFFGEDYSINSSLAYALQFSHMRSNQQLIAQKSLLSRDMDDIKKYIQKYKESLPQEVFDSQEYSIRLIQIPKVSNTNRSDLAIEFVNWNSLSPEDKDSYSKVVSIIKDKVILKTAANANYLRPTKVIEIVKKKTGVNISIHDHMLLWKSFGVRPPAKSESKFDTIEKYCLFDEVHNDYVYTKEWADFICRLVSEYGFNHDKIQKLSSNSLRSNDYL